MIVVTGAAGFIGSNLVKRLNEEGYKDLLLVDDFSDIEKNKNLVNKECAGKIDINSFIEWFLGNKERINFVFHLGAKTDTTLDNKKIFNELNLNYTKEIWKVCAEQRIPLVYASSASTYGLGEHGYEDNHDIVSKLKPLNYYGISKNEFDKWAIQQDKAPPYWVGLKFFNVYGPNEYHKGRMSSVVINSFKQIKKDEKVTLFRSHNKKYRDGEQLRDFIYVKDVVDICLYFLKKKLNSGIYNVGTGKARTFYDLAKSVFVALEKDPIVDFIDTPPDIRDKYQYFTEADISKLRKVDYKRSFYSLEDGIKDYVQEYLIKGKYN